MFEYLKKQLYTMLDMLLAPFWSWLTRSSWTVRFVVFLLCSLLLGAIVYPAAVRDSVMHATCFYRALAKHKESFPVSATTRQTLESLQSHLKLSVRSDLGNLRAGILTPWSSSQAVLALSMSASKEPLGASEIVSYIRANKLPACGCWHEVLGGLPADPICVFASGWIFSAMANMQVAVQPDELDFLVRSQSPTGWWSMYPVAADHNEYASTYATAWNILGLQAQLEGGLIPEASRAVVAAAISRGAAWLLSVRSESARWRSYPNSPNSKVSESISGLVVHALHHTVAEQSAEIERAWLTSLPAVFATISDTDPVYVEIYSGGKLVGIDQFIQIRLPWMLIATSDSYSSGSILEKSKALFWVEQVFAQDGMSNADAGLAQWWRAEFLLAVGTVLKASS